MYITALIVFTVGLIMAFLPEKYFKKLNNGFAGGVAIVLGVDIALCRLTYDFVNWLIKKECVYGLILLFVLCIVIAGILLGILYYHSTQERKRLNNNPNKPPFKAECEICYFTQKDIFTTPKEELEENNNGEDCNPLHTREES